MRKDRLPDLPEIMSYGLGLSEALAFWSWAQNAPAMTPDGARERLARASDPQPSLSSSGIVLQFSRPPER